METLTSDCLHEILSYLSFKDKFIYQTVSKQWRDVLKRLLLSKKQLSLNEVTKEHFGEPSYDKLTKYLLQQCPNIQYFNGSGRVFDLELFSPVSHSICSLVDVSLGWSDRFSPRSHRDRILSKFCNLVELRVRFISSHDLKMLCNSSSKSLKVVSFTRFEWWNIADVMMHLPCNIECLHLKQHVHLKSLPTNLNLPFAGKLSTLSCNAPLMSPFTFASLMQLDCQLDYDHASEDGFPYKFFDSLIRSTRLHSLKVYNVRPFPGSALVKIAQHINIFPLLRKIDWFYFDVAAISELNDFFHLFCLNQYCLRLKFTCEDDLELHMLTALPDSSDLQISLTCRPVFYSTYVLEIISTNQTWSQLMPRQLVTQWTFKRVRVIRSTHCAF